MEPDSIEVLEQIVIVYLHDTAPSATCPQCGTAGSRVHSRYERTIADIAFGGRHLELKLLVYKWICPEASCSRSSSIVDPYLSYLASRWNQGCHNVARLYEEIVAQGYTGSRRTLELRLRPFRPQGARLVSKQTVTLVSLLRPEALRS